MALVWAGGLALAGSAYLVGPDRFLDAALRLGAMVEGDAADILMHLGTRAYDLVRALALGCFAVFVVLAVIAAGRGHAVRAVLLVVTGLFLALVWHAGPDGTGHWTLACVLAAAAALNMTRRLTPAAALFRRREEMGV